MTEQKMIKWHNSNQQAGRILPPQLLHMNEPFETEFKNGMTAGTRDLLLQSYQMHKIFLPWLLSRNEALAPPKLQYRI